MAVQKASHYKDMDMFVHAIHQHHFNIFDTLILKWHIYDIFILQYIKDYRQHI